MSMTTIFEHPTSEQIAADHARAVDRANQLGKRDALLEAAPRQVLGLGIG